MSTITGFSGATAGMLLAGQLLAGPASAQITFYEADGFRGRVFATDRAVADFARQGFNDRASSVVVDHGRWEACENANFSGRCVVLRAGSYDSLTGMGLNDRISSVRPVDEGRRYPNESPEPLPAPTYEYRRRPGERLHEVPVTSVRAVVGQSEKRCWIERDPVDARRRSEPNVGGAVVGALIGGVLGHQIGGGRGNQLATVGGAVAGGAIGAQVGRDRTEQGDLNVRRCEQVSDEKPEYWDVTYDFRGVEHRVQLAAPPGRTIEVDQHGDPRQ
jgi:uncharacterized protein YcfJ